LNSEKRETRIDGEAGTSSVIHTKEQAVMKRACYIVMVAAIAASGISCARTAGPVTTPSLSAGDPGWVARTMKRMTVEEKVGQLITPRFSQTFRGADDDTLMEYIGLVRDGGIGGIILSAGEPYETAILLNRLQRLAKVPLLISADLESGTGSKIGGATLFPPLMSLGAAGSEALAFEMGRITALEARAVGIHQDYAPVVDVNVNPDNPIINTRSVGEDPEYVGRMAVAFVKGAQANGMIATAKHFPGHGDTALDSHRQLPTITGDRARLDRVELLPFRRVIDAGIQSVMTAHLAVPALDPTPDLPATLSAAITAGLLRKDMGFRGLIVTDALDMGGVTNAFTPEESSLKALLAGADVLLMPPTPAKVIAYLADAVRSGRVPGSRLDESVKRILEAKARLGLPKNRYVDVDALPRKLGTKANLAQAMKVFEGAATLVKNEGGVLPLAGTGKRIAVFALSSDLGDYHAGQAFVDAMTQRSPGCEAYFADGDTGDEVLGEAEAKAAGADAVVFALFSTLRSWKGTVDLDPKHGELVKRIAAGGRPVIVVSFGSPYFLRHFPDIGAYLCMYRNTPQTQEIAARALFGEMDLRGKLPVSMPGLYPAGHGLILEKR
jgi:beta-N-acetylhexosaminidase